MIQDAKFKRSENYQVREDKRGVEPEGFEWEADGIGRIVFTPHVTDIDFTVEGYNFKAHLTKEVSACHSMLHNPFHHKCAILTSLSIDILSDQIWAL